MTTAAVGFVLCHQSLEECTIFLAIVRKLIFFWKHIAKKYCKNNGIPYGIRTRVAAVKGRCPRPLD
ncbi:hypothetical protein, partial [Acetobacter orientalis]|uniref:hypothetical protein n=1 Tax=Acetobacter orientalis TaxID=146474 RepID=UPI001C4F6134